MINKSAYNWLLTFLLVCGFSFLGGQLFDADLNTDNKNLAPHLEEITASDLHLKFSETLETRNVKLLAEIGEESKEEDTEVSSKKNALTTTYSTSYGRDLFYLVNSEFAKNPFSKTELLDSTPLYIQYEVYRL